MIPASTIAGGMAFAMPDVCKTPTPAGPVPIPYPNTAQLPMAVQTTVKVSVMNMPALVVTSKIPLSSGDEAGTAGGVVSGMFIGEVSFKKGSSKVMFEGKGVLHVSAVSGHNGSNANAPGGMIAAPSQTVVLVGP